MQVARDKLQVELPLLAAALLALADDNGLAHLRAVALDYCVHNFEAVAKTGVGGAGVAMKLG